MFALKNWTLRDLPNARTTAYDDAEARLDAIDEALKELPSADYVTAMRRAAASLRAPFKVSATALKVAARTYYDQKAMADDASKLAEKAVPQNVDMGNVNARPEAVRAATQSIFDAFWKSKVEEAAAREARVADEVARACVDALRAARASLDKAIAKATGPLAMRDGAKLDMDRLSLVAGLREELKATYKPSGMLALFETYVASDDEENELLFTQAVSPLLADLGKLSLSQLATQLEMRLPSQPQRDGGEVGKEQGAIAQLRRRIAEREAERVPEALKVCEYAYSQLASGVFGLLMGTNALVLSRAEYEARYLKGTPDPLSYDPRWLVKALPPNAPSL